MNKNQKKNVALGLALLSLAIIFYFVTIIKF